MCEISVNTGTPKLIFLKATQMSNHQSFTGNFEIFNHPRSYMFSPTTFTYFIAQGKVVIQNQFILVPDMMLKTPDYWYLLSLKVHCKIMFCLRVRSHLEKREWESDVISGNWAYLPSLILMLKSNRFHVRFCSMWTNLWVVNSKSVFSHYQVTLVQMVR